MALGREARREVSEGGVGGGLGVGIFWELGVGDCGLCFQAGYFVCWRLFLLSAGLTTGVFFFFFFFGLGSMVELGNDDGLGELGDR